MTKEKNCLCIFAITFSIVCSSAFAKEKLLFSIDLIRHGDRTPTNEIPKSPHIWKEGLGQLTEKGINQEIQLGKALRKKYVDQFHLLPENYRKGSIYVRSTNVQRAITSAHALLLGLYPLKTRPLSNQKITPETVSISKDNVLLVKPTKNIFSLIKLYFTFGQYWRNKTRNIQDKLNYWSAQTGLKLNKFQQLAALADNLYIRRLHHVPLPKGVSNNDANTIIGLAENAQIKYFTLKEITYSTGHMFIKTVSNYFEQRIQGQSPLRYVLFSGHDSSIMSVMSTLGVPLKRVPNYASHLNFSLFQNKNNYYVRVSYNNKLINIPSCEGNYCELLQFKKLTETW